MIQVIIDGDDVFFFSGFKFVIAVFCFSAFFDFEFKAMSLVKIQAILSGIYGYKTLKNGQIIFFQLMLSFLTYQNTKLIRGDQNKVQMIKKVQLLIRCLYPFYFYFVSEYLISFFTYYKPILNDFKIIILT